MAMPSHHDDNAMATSSYRPFITRDLEAMLVGAGKTYDNALRVGLLPLSGGFCAQTAAANDGDGDGERRKKTATSSGSSHTAPPFADGNDLNPSVCRAADHTPAAAAAKAQKKAGPPPSAAPALMTAPAGTAAFRLASPLVVPPSSSCPPSLSSASAPSSSPFFPFDFSAMLYQSRAKLALIVPPLLPTSSSNSSGGSAAIAPNKSSLSLPTTTRSQRELVMHNTAMAGSGTAKHSGNTDSVAAGGTTGTIIAIPSQTSDATCGGALATTIETHLDIMSLHRLLMPPSFEDEAGGVGNGGGGDAVPLSTGHVLGRIIMAANWQSIIGALFPLTIAGKGPVLKALAASKQKKKKRNNASPTNNVSTSSSDAMSPLPLPFSFLSISGWKALRYDSHITDRFSYSYSLWLTFYGWRLHDEGSGEVDRHATWRQRYDELRTGSGSGRTSQQRGGGRGGASASAATAATARTPLPPASRLYYLTITTVLQCLLELKLFPLAARLMLFLCEEFAAGRCLWLLERRGDWFDCDYSTLLPMSASPPTSCGVSAGAERSPSTTTTAAPAAAPMRCQFCGGRGAGGGGVPPASPAPCPYLLSIGLLQRQKGCSSSASPAHHCSAKQPRDADDSSSSSGSDDDADAAVDLAAIGGRDEERDVAVMEEGEEARFTKAPTITFTTDKDNHSSRAPSGGRRGIVTVVTQEGGEEEEQEEGVSLFDDLWLPILRGFNHSEGNCYDGNGDMGRVERRRAAIDESDSE